MTTTDSHSWASGGATRVHIPHSAQPGEEIVVDLPRPATLIDYTPDGAQSASGCAPGVPVPDAKPQDVTPRDKCVRWVTSLKVVFTPPDLWNQPQPPLSHGIDRAVHGQWTTAENGLIRTLAKAYAYGVAVPIITACYALAWIAGVPSRLTAATVLYVLLAQVPPLSWLL